MAQTASRGRSEPVEPARPDPHPPPRGRIRVILVDDRAQSRRAVAALLGTCEDIEVVGQATDGAEALALVDRVQPNLVVMDVFMPGMDGVQATALIKQRHPRVRVLVLSLSLDAAERAIAAGADAFLVKGEPEDVLLGTIRGLA